MTTAEKVDLAGDGFFVLVDLLEAAKAGLPEEVPSALDDQFREMASAYRKAAPAVRQQVRELIPKEYWLPLLQLGDRCAEWAMSDKDPQHLDDGLTAYCIEDFRLDAQENLLHLSPVVRGQDVARRHHREIFNHVGQCASPRGLQELSNCRCPGIRQIAPCITGLEIYRGEVPDRVAHDRRDSTTRGSGSHVRPPRRWTA